MYWLLVWDCAAKDANKDLRSSSSFLLKALQLNNNIYKLISKLILIILLINIYTDRERQRERDLEAEA